MCPVIIQVRFHLNTGATTASACRRVQTLRLPAMGTHSPCLSCRALGYLKPTNF